MTRKRFHGARTATPFKGRLGSTSTATTRTKTRNTEHSIAPVVICRNVPTTMSPWEVIPHRTQSTAGASEGEVRAMLDLELGHKNIRAVVDFHTSGRMVFFPDNTDNKNPELVPKATYLRLGNKIAQNMLTPEDDPFDVRPFSCFQGPVAGNSSTVLHANGLLALTVELSAHGVRRPQGYELLRAIENGVRASFVVMDDLRADRNEFTLSN